MRDFRKLEVWQRSRELAGEIYRITSSFPQAERYGMIAQSRGSAVSVPANISEGCGRETVPDFLRCLHIASGSLSEPDCLMILAHAFRFVHDLRHSAVENQIAELRRLLFSFMTKLNADC